MLQLSETRIIRSLPENVAPGVIVPEEGIALAYVKVNGEMFVQPSTGANGEQFAGISYSRAVAPNIIPYVEAITAELTGKFARVPVTGQLRVKTAAGAALTVINTGTPTNVQILVVGQDYTVHADNEGEVLTAQYHYVPSVIEAKTYIGEAPIGGLASSEQETIGSIKQATVSTNFFDISKDWTTTVFAKLGAGGVLTPGTLSDHIDGVVVRNTPTVDNAMLTISLNVA